MRIWKKFKREIITSNDFMTLSQLYYIEAISKLESPTATELADYLGLTKASVSNAVSKLEKGGYVKKTQSLTDKRIYHLALTEASVKIIGAEKKAVGEFIKKIDGALTRAEKATLISILGKFLETYENN